MTTRIWTGTASVVSGYTTVVLSGNPLTDANCPADGMIVLGGATYFVGERVDTMTVELTRPYEGADDSAVTAEIDPLNANAISLVTVSRSVTEYNAKLSLIDANGRGLFYKSKGFTGANDPGPGYLGRDAGDWPDLTSLYFDVLDQNGQDISDQIELFTSGDILIVRSIATNAVARVRVDTIFNESGWFNVGVTYLGGSDIIADEEELAVEWRRMGTGIAADIQVGTRADLVGYESQAVGFAILVSDYDGNGRSAVVTLLESGSPTSWSDPAYISGPQGVQGDPGLIGDWKGPWAAGTDFTINDAVSEGGSSYICKIPHTSGTFATDLADGKWELVASKGDTGSTGAAGTNGTNGTNGADGAGFFSRVRALDTSDSDPATSGYTNGATIDGVTLATNDLVIRASSSHQARNGIWVVAAVGGASRQTAFDTFDEHPGVYVSVMEGTAYADTLWRCTSNKGGTLDTDPIVFGQFSTDLTEINASLDDLNSSVAALAQQASDNANLPVVLGASGNIVADSFDVTTKVDTINSVNLDTGTAGALKPTSIAGGTVAGPGGGGGGGAYNTGTGNNTGNGAQGGGYGSGAGSGAGASSGPGSGITGKPGLTVIQYTPSGGSLKVILLTSGTSWTVPADWNNSSNSIETIGGGGGSGNGGLDAGLAGGSGGGGGGGAYSKITNLTLTPGASITYQIGAAGAQAGAGGDTWFNGASLAASSVGSKGGGAGTNASGTTGGTGGTGGAAASGVGTTKNSGGNGGNGRTSVGAGAPGAGGGGAAGPNGDGKNGSAPAASPAAGAGAGGGANNGSAAGSPSGSTGGTGGNGRAGTGGGVAGNPGGAGTASSGAGGGGATGANVSAANLAGGVGAQDDVWTSTTFTNNATIYLGPFTAATAPAFLEWLRLRVKEVDAAAAGTDYTLRISRDNKTTWTAVTLSELFTADLPEASARIVSGARTDISAQPSSTTMWLEFKNLNNKMVWLLGYAMKWTG